MTASIAPPVAADRVPPADKFERRRAELADATLHTLGELGYARTSLREIAHNSSFSHGVLHYYFRDKLDLITYGVRRYKQHCVTRYDEIVATARTADELCRRFADKLVETIVEDGPMHRLWYDLRTQSMFDEALRPDVLYIDTTLEAMIWRVLTRYAELAESAIRVPSARAYAMLDGVFERTLLQHSAGETTALDELRSTTVDTLPLLLA
jgi:AcrR family transcriptional regulator